MTAKLLLGDMTEVLSHLNENSVDVCVTDPPYGMDIVGEHWDSGVPTSEMWSHVERVLKPGGFILSFSSPKNYHRMAIEVENAGFEPKDMFQWVMSYKMPRGNNVRSCHEPIFVGQKAVEGNIEENVKQWGVGKIDTDNNRIPWYKEPPKGWPDHSFELTSFGKKKTGRADPNYKPSANVARDADDRGRIPCNVIGETSCSNADKFFYTPRVNRKERGEYNDHPTPKPIALMQHLVRLFAPEGSIVLDPFMGSGSTGIACVLENREFIGIDMDSHYIQISRKRIKDHTGQDAILVPASCYQNDRS